MAKITFNPNRKGNQLIDHFRVRLIAKLVVIFICLTLLAQRLAFALASTDISEYTIQSFVITSPFLVALSSIVLIEYILYRKLGVRILRYSKYVDFIFIIVFTVEWIVTLHVSLHSGEGDDDTFHGVSGTISFSSFSWRALLPILITQIWYFRIIPPTAAYLYLLIFAADTQPDKTFFILFKGILQILYVILIYYFDHKINFRVLIGSIQQEQWLQLNDFILNNIPENIAIMDPSGDCNFINENFKKLLQKHNQLNNIKNFLANIKRIQRIQQERETEADDYAQEILPLERISSSESRNDADRDLDSEVISNLDDLIVNFGNLIKLGSISANLMQMFTSKFKQEGIEEERSFEIKISYINHQPDKYILLILRDTTTRDQLLTLEGNIKYKDQLLASVSHELRTPLNGNINLVEAAIKSQDIPDKLKERLLIPAVRSSQFLLHLINDILDMSQIKAQKLRLVFQQANLKETLGNTIQLLELHARKKAVTLQTDFDPDLSEAFCTDHVRLSQIVLNLINNSIKFTQKGYVKLSAWPLRNANTVQISVEDTGIGMTEEDTRKLFQGFTHIEFKNRERINPTGVGLGLKIANDLSKLLGPENNQGIIVNSEVEKGSTFSFFIDNKEIGLGSQDIKIEEKEEASPLIANEYQISTEQDLKSKVLRTVSIPAKSMGSLGKIELTSMTSVPSCTCPKVLVVDDDPFNIMAYEAILDSIGVRYDCVYSGKSAIDKMLNKVRYPCSSVCCPYRVVFMDEEMPDMTGRETVIEIVNLQRQNLLPPMKIIGCTAHHSGEAIEGFLKSGISEYVPKPVSSAMIQKILEKYNI